MSDIFYWTSTNGVNQVYKDEFTVVRTMTRRMYDDVGCFHVKFNLPVAMIAFGGPPSESWPIPIEREPALLNEREFKYRCAFLDEELQEYKDAHAAGDLAKCLDALCDLVWIALGTAHYHGFPFNTAWEEVKRANMQKRPWKEGDPIKKRNADGATTGLEVVKPEGWRPPDIEGVLREFIETYWNMRRV